LAVASAARFAGQPLDGNGAAGIDAGLVGQALHETLGAFGHFAGFEDSVLVLVEPGEEVGGVESAPVAAAFTSASFTSASFTTAPPAAASLSTSLKTASLKASTLETASLIAAAGPTESSTAALGPGRLGGNGHTHHHHNGESCDEPHSRNPL
jgi:hypothetical protein